MAFTSVTLTGTVDLANSTPASGATVQATLNAPITDGVTVVEPQALSTRCLSDGTFSLAVLANDDTTTQPTGTFYQIVVIYGSQILQQFNVVVPHADAPTVNLYTLARLTNPQIAQPYVSQLLAGTGITLSPPGGTGQVTVSSSGGSGSSGSPGAGGATGITGATAATRYVGGTASGHPSTGTFAVGDFVVDQTGAIWVCTAAGTPGTWADSAGSGVKSSQQSGSTYTFVLGDAGTVVESTGASAATFTIPPNSSVAFPVGTLIEIFQDGAGQVTIAAGAGVTLRYDGNFSPATNAQYATVGLRQRAANEWVLSGDLA